jgi:hypothetical protein
MAAREDILADRLNAEPAIFKGCSSSELGVIVGVAALVWLPMSLLLAGLVGAVTMGFGLRVSAWSGPSLPRRASFSALSATARTATTSSASSSGSTTAACGTSRVVQHGPIDITPLSAALRGTRGAACSPGPAPAVLLQYRVNRSPTVASTQQHQ